MEGLDRLRLSSVAYARYAPSSSRAFHGKEPSRITHPTFPMACQGVLQQRPLGDSVRIIKWSRSGA
ncbi:MAG: hypothetical protein KTR25_09025 [Myxococcales bacterium]|nr:hypothetical protein [Myxococcales bacterium]